ncbi:MAG: hypothetical protein WCI51_19705 [Lentisphaerota bacterium]
MVTIKDIAREAAAVFGHSFEGVSFIALLAAHAKKQAYDKTSRTFGMLAQMSHLSHF